MSRAAVYLSLAVFGLAVQLAIAGWFLADEGLDLGELVDQATASPMAWLALTDVLLSAVAFLAWMPREARRVGVGHPWRYALATAGGLCFALPLFLSARKRRLSDAPS